MSENIAHQNIPRNVGTPLPFLPTPPSKSRSSGLRSFVKLALSLLGLALTLSIALAQFWPQMTATPQDPIAKSQPFTSPFRIENTSYFSLWVEHVYCYVGDAQWNFVTMKRVLERSHDWEHFLLQRNESKTILCNVLDAPTPPQQTDIVIAVDYRPLPFLPWTLRKLFRFTGAHVDQWQWLRQPIGPIEAETNRAIDRLADTGRSRYQFERGGIQ